MIHQKSHSVSTNDEELANSILSLQLEPQKINMAYKLPKSIHMGLYNSSLSDSPMEDNRTNKGVPGFPDFPDIWNGETRKRKTKKSKKKCQTFQRTAVNKHGIHQSTVNHIKQSNKVFKKEMKMKKRMKKMAFMAKLEKKRNIKMGMKDINKKLARLTCS